MARPIEPTPPLEGDDALRLLKELADVAPLEVIEARRTQAQVQLADMMRPKGFVAKPAAPPNDPRK